MGPGSDFWRVFVVRVLLSRPDLRLCAARLRCLACVDGPVLDRVHVFLHVTVECACGARLWSASVERDCGARVWSV